MRPADSAEQIRFGNPTGGGASCRSVTLMMFVGTPHLANRQPLFMLPKIRLAANIWGVTYQAQPISTEGVDLPPALLPLTERLAQNAHDLWAAQRLAQGWRFGPQRDDSKKLQPCMVPYTDLPESEKEYDRSAALGTLKAILKLGYRILPPQP